MSPYVGAKLALCVEAMVAPTRSASEGMADRGRHLMRDGIRAKTPVDTGHLHDSWRLEHIVTRHLGSVTAYETGVFTETEYAPEQEFGWGLWGPNHAKYPIRPKNPDGWLHWIDPKTGKDRFAKLVMHPGAKGFHMVARTAAEMEAGFSRLMEPSVRRWAVTAERAFEAGGRR